MLCMRCVGVLGAAAALHKDGLIRYTRSQITILDRPRLGRRQASAKRW